MIYTVTKKQTLLEALSFLAPESSKTTLREWIKYGRIQVDGKKETISNKALEPNQIVTLGTLAPKPLEHGLSVIYKDAHIVAIDKPSGLLSVATASETEATAHNVLKKYFHPKRVFVVHRLDQDTSGVMLFALTEEARDKLKETFEKHDIKRSYTAIVEGKLPIDSKGTWQCHLYEDASYKVHVVQENHKNFSQAKLAITHYHVVSNKGPFTRLILTLETGKKNQIRVHCQHAGNPVIGDVKYGYQGTLTTRLALHAHTLELLHPITNKNLYFESKVPNYFAYLCP